MADVITPVKTQSLTEQRVWEFDFTDDLLAGVTVTTATAVHTPPSGSALTPLVGMASGAIVPVQLGSTSGTLTVTGYHTLDCTATLSDGEKSSIRLLFNVTY